MEDFNIKKEDLTIGEAEHLVKMGARVRGRYFEMTDTTNITGYAVFEGGVLVSQDNTWRKYGGGADVFGWGRSAIRTHFTYDGVGTSTEDEVDEFFSLLGKARKELKEKIKLCGPNYVAWNKLWCRHHRDGILGGGERE